MSEKLTLLISSVVAALIAKPEPPKPSFASKHGNTAQLVSAVVAVIAAILVVTQVYFISRNFKEASARQVYMSYSEASLRYPEFVEPDLAAIRTTPNEYVRYKNFVYHMLFAYDEILDVYDTPEWRKSLDVDIKFHMPFICNDMNVADDMSYYKEIRDVLREVRIECSKEKEKSK